MIPLCGLYTKNTALRSISSGLKWAGINRTMLVKKGELQMTNPDYI
jgi:hypothetical protein